MVNQPIQRFTSRILSLCLFDSQTTVQLQQVSSKILQNNSTKGREKESFDKALNFMTELSINLKDHVTKEKEKYIKIIVIGGKRHDKIMCSNSVDFNGTHSKQATKSNIF